VNVTESTVGGGQRANGDGHATPPADLTAELDLTSTPPQLDLHDPTIRRAAERALTDIPGILAARLVPGFEREIDELHVVTDLDRTPKRTVRDVQTLLMARFGVTTDHRVVSVVQLDERAPLAATRRVVIESVGLSGNGIEVAATVVLRSDDGMYEGQAQGSGSGAGRHRTTAAATLDAVRPLLAAGSVVELTGIELVNIGTTRIAVAVLEVTSPRTSTTLSGSAVVRDAAPDAVVRAVLDALNRTISPKR
jgi:hypothetical protein